MGLEIKNKVLSRHLSIKFPKRGPPTELGHNSQAIMPLKSTFNTFFRRSNKSCYFFPYYQFLDGPLRIDSEKYRTKDFKIPILTKKCIHPEAFHKNLTYGARNSIQVWEVVYCISAHCFTLSRSGNEDVEILTAGPLLENLTGKSYPQLGAS